MADNNKPFDGPSVSVKVSCRRCSHQRSEYYCVEDGNDVDSGYNYSCAHPDGKGAMDDSTPEWCPMLGEKMSDDAVLNSATRLLRVAALTRVESFTTDAALVVMSIKAKAKEVDRLTAKLNEATRRILELEAQAQLAENTALEKSE